MRDLAWQRLGLDKVWRSQNVTSWSANANDRVSSVPSGFTAYLGEMFFDRGRKTYLIGENFFEALASVDLKVKPSHIQATEDPIWIQYPRPIRIEPNADIIKASGSKDGAIYLRGAFVSVDNVGFTSGVKALHILTYFFDRNGKPVPNRTHQLTMTPLYRTDGIDCTIEEVLELGGDFSFDRHHQLLLLKILIYIASGDPDLRYLQKPSGSRSRREHEKYYEADGQDGYNQSVFLVGFDWKKPKIYHVDGCVVRAHYRWQPCGKNREQVKLILIDQHERHYNTTEWSNEKTVGEETKQV